MAGTVAILSAGSTTPSAAQQIYLPDTGVAWAGVGLLLTFGAASATASVEVSGDGINWNAHDTLHGLTASANGNLAYPVLYVRLHLTAWTSGTVVLQIIQARYN